MKVEITQPRHSFVTNRYDEYITKIECVEGQLLDIPNNKDIHNIDLGDEDMKMLLFMFVPNGDVVELIEFDQTPNTQTFVFKTLRFYEHNH